MNMINIRSMALALCAATALSAGAQVSMSHNVTSYYEPMTAQVANYYVVLSDNPTATYNSQTGLVSMTGAGYLLALDLYAPITDAKPILLPAGTYVANDSQESFTYYGDDDISYIMKFNDKGVAAATGGLTGNITVTHSGNGNELIVKATGLIDGAKTEVEFTGLAVFENTEESPFVFPQLKKDIDCKFTDARAVYDGNLWNSNSGEFYLSLATVPVDTLNGAMMTPGGTRIAIMLYNRLFTNGKDAYVEPGTYTIARSMKRSTFYPGLEMDYAGVTFPFGTYVQQHAPGVYADSSFGYSYINDGTVEVERDANGIYDITIDLKTTYGHAVTGTFHGEIPVTDQSDGTRPTGISTLESDVECSLDQITVGRLQYNGLANNETCHSLILDIGSPSGKDQAVAENGGDIIRFEMLQSRDKPYLVEGTYTCTEYKWETYYAPFKLVHGHWSKLANGDLTGTRYYHFEEGRNFMVMDELAPAVEGTMALTKNDDNTWHVEFSLVDDIGFYITGKWDGPIEYTYDPNVVMAGSVSAEIGGGDVTLTRLSADSFRLGNLPADAVVAVYSVSGSRMNVSADAEGVVDMSSLSSGVYVINAAGQSFKVTK